VVVEVAALDQEPAQAEQVVEVAQVSQHYKLLFQQLLKHIQSQLELVEQQVQEMNMMLELQQPQQAAQPVL
jgi:Mg2+/Co2+ transporter CorC